MSDSETVTRQAANLNGSACASSQSIDKGDAGGGGGTASSFQLRAFSYAHFLRVTGHGVGTRDPGGRAGGEGRTRPLSHCASRSFGRKFNQSGELLRGGAAAAHTAPIRHIRSVERLTGPETDDLLVKTVGPMITVVRQMHSAGSLGRCVRGIGSEPQVGVPFRVATLAR
jgi:hypothetical protein